MTRQIVFTQKAAKPPATYSQAVKAAGLVFVSGTSPADAATGAIIGSTRYYDWWPQSREIAIGFTFLTRPYWGGGANHEMKQLMLSHAFKWADTVWFHVGEHNARSRRALEKIGARFTHQVEGKAFYRLEKPVTAS